MTVRNINYSGPYNEEEYKRLYDKISRISVVDPTSAGSGGFFIMEGRKTRVSLTHDGKTIRGRVVSKGSTIPKDLGDVLSKNGLEIIQE